MPTASISWYTGSITSRRVGLTELSHSMAESKAQSKTDHFILCNFEYISRKSSSIVKDQDAVDALQRFLGDNVPIAECQKLLSNSQHFCELIKKGKKYIDLRCNRQPSDMSGTHHYLKNPLEDLVTADGSRYREISIVAHLARLTLEALDFDISSSFNENDVKISKENIIASYLRFFSLRKKFIEIKGKIYRTLGDISSQNIKEEIKKATEHIIMPKKTSASNGSLETSEDTTTKEPSPSVQGKKGDIVEAVASIIDKTNQHLVFHKKLIFISSLAFLDVEPDRTSPIRERSRSISKSNKRSMSTND